MATSDNTSVYYLSDDAMIYPSSNSNDGGEDNSEINLKTITDKLAIKSFVVKRNRSTNGKNLPYFKLSPYTDGSVVKGVSMSAGECSINGYYFDLDSITIPTTDQQGNRILGARTKHIVFLRIFKDGISHIRGDGVSLDPNSPNEGVFECKGIKACIGTQDFLNSLEDSLVLPLGYFTTDNNGDPPASQNDYYLFDTRFAFIDSEVIVTSSGNTIEDWTNGRIVYKIGRLDQINHYAVNESPNALGKPIGVPTSTLKLTSNRDELIFIGYGDKTVEIVSPPGSLTTTSSIVEDTQLEFNIVDIENRTQVASAGGQTTPDGTASQGNTYNGRSLLLARADHDHDLRYLSLNPKNRHDQTVDSAVVTFNGIVESKQGLVYTNGIYSKFNIKIDDKGFTSYFVDEEGSTTKLLTTNIIKSGSSYKSMNLTLNGDFTATRVFNAVWNDYAELYRKYDESDTSDEGTVICKVEGSDVYSPSTYATRNLVVGIVTESYGHIIGGDKDKSLEENLKTHYAVSLAGRVKVKVVPGLVIREGDLLSASDQGRAEKAGKDSQGCVIGKALESSDGSKDKILVQVMLK